MNKRKNKNKKIFKQTHPWGVVHPKCDDIGGHLEVLPHSVPVFRGDHLQFVEIITLFGHFQIFNKLTLKRLSVFSGIFEAHLEEIVNAGFDVNVVAASMSVDTVGHFHRSRLFGSNQFDLYLEYGSTFTFTFVDGYHATCTLAFYYHDLHCIVGMSNYSVRSLTFNDFSRQL